MTLETLRAFFGYCTIINWALLLVWFVFFTLGHDWMQKLHGKWFRLSVETFDDANYRAMAVFKLGVILFNLTPYLVLRLLV